MKHTRSAPSNIKNGTKESDSTRFFNSKKQWKLSRRKKKRTRNLTRITSARLAWNLTREQTYICYSTATYRGCIRRSTILRLVAKNVRTQLCLLAKWSTQYRIFSACLQHSLATTSDQWAHLSNLTSYTIRSWSFGTLEWTSTLFCWLMPP